MTDDARIEELVLKYGDLAKQLAWKYYKKLSPATKMWVDPEDMIAEAFLCFVTKVKDKYDPSRASECTFAFWAINNALQNFCIAQQQGKRRALLLSLDEALEAIQEGMAPQFNTKYLAKPDEQLKLREAMDAMVAVYQAAGDECKSEMRRWFGQNYKEKPRRSAYYKLWNAEFKYLANKFRLTKEDCRLLMRSGVVFA